MTTLYDEAAFLHAIDADPREDAPRLIYADWLDEQGHDAAAEFLRAELDLAHLDRGAPTTADARERLWQAWATIDRRRFHEFTQPRRMRANPTPYRCGWPLNSLSASPSHDLPAEDAWAKLPSLPAAELNGTYQYLEGERERSQGGSYDAFNNACYEQLLADAESYEVELPLDYLRFMRDHELRAIVGTDATPETNYHFTFPNHYFFPIGYDDHAGCVRVTFLCECQARGIVDLYVHPSGASCVVDPSGLYTSSDEYASSTATEAPPAHLDDWCRFVAPSFEALVYRMWVEGQAMRSYGRRATASTSPRVQAYLDALPDGTRSAVGWASEIRKTPDGFHRA